MRRSVRRLIGFLLALLLGALRPRALGLRYSRAGFPRALGEFTAALALARELDTERQNREAALAAAGEADIASLASIHLRHALANLLRWCHEQGPSGDVSFVAASRLTANRDAIDQLLATSASDEADGASGAAARAALRRFVEHQPLRTAALMTTDVASFDDALLAFIAPIVEASGSPPHEATSPWPRRSQLDLRAPPPAATTPMEPSGERRRDPPRDAGELRTRILNAPLDQPTREALLAHADKLRLAERFVDLQPSSQRSIAALAPLIDAVETIHDLTWLDAPAKEVRTTRLVEALMTAAGHSVDRASHPHLIGAGRHAALMRRITALAEANVEVRELAKVDALIDEMLASSERASIALRQLPLLIRLLDRMIETRELKADALKRSDLRQVYERLLRDALAAEKQVVSVMRRLASEPASEADVAVGALLADHAQLVEDVRRVRNVDGWVDRVARINPRAESRFHNQVRRMCASLADMNRRDDTVRAMDSFQRQLAWFYPLPLEDRLAELDRDVIELTGGRQQELRNLINSARADWAEAWAAGDAASEAGGRLLLLYRLMRSAEEAMALRGGGAANLSAWGPWNLAPGALEQPTRDMSGFLKLAVAAMVMGDWPEARRHANAINSIAPSARLTGRLALVVRPALGESRLHPRNIVAMHARPPGDDAWLIDRRTELAHFCRCAAELQFARGNDDRELAQSLQTYLDALARDLLASELNDPPGALPDIPGFDGG